MRQAPAQIDLAGWDQRYQQLTSQGLRQPGYGGPLRRHVERGDTRLLRLRFDNSAAALRLWNFLLSEEDRLRLAREQGQKIVGAMKDLGTVPVLAFAFPQITAFYPDGAWWIPCVMEASQSTLALADAVGLDESFCPVRAMVGAFLNREHFPIPDLLVCSVGAVCDDFSAIAQRLEHLGHPVFWWEMPARRHPDPGEPAVVLPGGFTAPAEQVAQVHAELGRIKTTLEALAGHHLDDAELAAGIGRANRVRRILADLRRLAFTAPRAPMPALEMLVAEMMAIHFCSDPAEVVTVLEELRAEAQRRVAQGVGMLGVDAVPVFWVNPVADLCTMNLLEEVGGRICGTDYLFGHALDEIPTQVAPLEALARTALADPMVGSTADRAARIAADARRFGARAVVISRIPGASHCAFEGGIIGDELRRHLGVPVLEIEVPPITDALRPTLRTRLEALVETARERSRA